MTAGLAVVSLPALDLRARPEHRAEMGSQLLMGEVVRCGPPRRGWRRVENLSDGYSGWVRDWGLVAASRARAAAWRSRAVAVLATPIALAKGRPGGGIGVGPLFLGCRAIPGRISSGWIRLEFPDARFGWVERSAIRLPDDPAPSLPDRITSLLGVPYLWGGRTPAGYDCSALVQQVLLEQGVKLPRDAADQCRTCRRLRAGEAPSTGDLVFFEDRPGRIAHVGISLSGSAFAHARGRVAIASVEPGNAMYDKDLAPQCVGWYRVRRGMGPAEFPGTPAH